MLMCVVIVAVAAASSSLTQTKSRINWMVVSFKWSLLFSALLFLAHNSAVCLCMRLHFFCVILSDFIQCCNNLALLLFPSFFVIFGAHSVQPQYSFHRRRICVCVHQFCIHYTDSIDSRTSVGFFWCPLCLCGSGDDIVVGSTYLKMY